MVRTRGVHTLADSIGNVIANAGYVKTLGDWHEASGKYQLPPNATALWGAMQSLGQLIGMIFLNPVSDRIGRKMTLYLLWVVLAGVSPYM